MKRSGAISVVALLGMFAVVMPASAKAYRNKEFGFSVEMPRGLPACAGDDGELRSTGVDFWLDGGPSGCGGLNSRPFISVTGSYNAGFSPSPEERLRHVCHGKPAEPPPGLAFPGKRSAACRADIDDGWIVVHVVAQGGAWPDPGSDPELHTPWINYTVVLQTKPERFDADLTRLRAVLKTIRLFKPAT
jgi:hypothetical protein